MPIAFIGSAEGSATNGGTITLTFASTGTQAGACAIVAYAFPGAAAAMQVTSSSTSTPYTQILTTVSTTNLNFSVWRRILPTAETQAICSGTARTSDGISAVCLLFSGVDPTTPESATPTSSGGSSTTPNSPSITVGSADNAVISAVASAVTDTAVTAPTSFINQVDATGNDTLDTTTGIAWIALTASGAFDPASWTGFTTGRWVAASIALQPEFIWSDTSMVSLPDFRSMEIVGY